MHCRMCSSLLGLYPLDASSTPRPVCQSRMSPGIVSSPQEVIKTSWSSPNLPAIPKTTWPIRIKIRRKESDHTFRLPFNAPPPHHVASQMARSQQMCIQMSIDRATSCLRLPMVFQIKLQTPQLAQEIRLSTCHLSRLWSPHAPR